VTTTMRGRRLRAATGAVLLGLALVGTAATAATATAAGTTGAGGATQVAPLVGTARAAIGDQTTGREITRYDATAVLDADGLVHVTLDFDFDFGDSPGHGPYFTLPLRQGYDSTRDRVYRYSDLTASSSTGAPAQINREDAADVMTVKIGDPNNGAVSGVQTYTVSYTVDGWVNPVNAKHSGDELYWNVIGSDWVIPISRLTLKVTGPSAVQDAACFAGPYGSTDPCTSSAFAGDGATFTQDMLAAGDGWTTVTGWPGGTFHTQPILAPVYDQYAAVRPGSVGGAIALAVLVAGAALATIRVRRVGRDQEYLGLTPGLRPAQGQEAAIGARRASAVSVQFTPPEGTRPGEIGTLVDEKADPIDVTATLIDLAVRGYLRIEEVPRKDPGKKPKDWTLVATPGGDDSALLPFERTLLDDVFEGRQQVQLSALRTTFAASMASVQSGLYQHVTDNGWFRANPRSVRNSWLAVSGLLIAGGAVGGFFAFSTQVRGLALIGFAVALVGVLVALMSRAAPARTALGTAVLAQALGFRRYIATAEANQLRFEEGEDIFSRYLPYAIVFGLTDRWARVFAELAAQGRAVAQPTWYYGYYSPGQVFWATSFASSMERFSSVATTTMSAPTPGSSGSSGFGGGGFSGGGVGGGGGGGW